jgi:nucleoside-diphosphate-sugar epimerase
VSVLILGGNRFMGRHLAEMLIAAGETPVVLNRGSKESLPGTEFIAGDRSRPDGLAGLGDRKFDAVVDLSAYHSQWVRDAIAALAGRVGHYVFISSGVVYRRAAEMPWSESSTIDPDPAWGTYAIEKAASERMLSDAARRGDFRVTILRPPFVMGAGNYADRESFVFSRLHAGRPILLPGGGRAVNQYIHAADVARAIVAVVDRPGSAPVRAFNVGLPSIVSNRSFAELCAAASGMPLEAVAIDAGALGVAEPVVDLADVVFPFPDAHSYLDVRGIEAAVGFTPEIGLEASLAEYHAWWLQQADRRPREYPRETRALKALAGKH